MKKTKATQKKAITVADPPQDPTADDVVLDSTIDMMPTKNAMDIAKKKRENLIPNKVLTEICTNMNEMTKQAECSTALTGGANLPRFKNIKLGSNTNNKTDTKMISVMASRESRFGYATVPGNAGYGTLAHFEETRKIYMNPQDYEQFAKYAPGKRSKNEKSSKTYVCFAVDCFEPVELEGGKFSVRCKECDSIFYTRDNKDRSKVKGWPKLPVSFEIGGKRVSGS
jgi:hypothetical protein